MGEVGQEWDGIRYYYDDTSHMLLDVNRGVFKYDSNTHSLALVLPLRIHERRLLVCLLKYQCLDVTLACLLKKIWQGRTVSNNTRTITFCKLQEVLLSSSECQCFKIVTDIECVASSHKAGLLPVISLDFFLASFRWSLPNTVHI